MIVFLSITALSDGGKITEFIWSVCLHFTANTGLLPESKSLSFPCFALICFSFSVKLLCSVQVVKTSSRSSALRNYRFPTQLTKIDKSTTGSKWRPEEKGALRNQRRQKQNTGVKALVKNERIKDKRVLHDLGLMNSILNLCFFPQRESSSCNFEHLLFDDHGVTVILQIKKNTHGHEMDLLNSR